MRQRWLRTVALSLGILMTGRFAFIVAETPPSTIQPYPPVATPPPLIAPEGKPNLQTVENADTAPAASLDRPIALRDENPENEQKNPTHRLVLQQRQRCFCI